MKIYTKTGDRGSTSLFNGTRVQKHHSRIDTYGTLDELNAFVGLLREELKAAQTAENFSDLLQALERVQNELFDLGAELANPNADKQLEKLGITQLTIERLESEIDHHSATLAALRFFILPGGHRSNAVCHVCRTICRRAERQLVKLQQEESIREVPTIYLNRLSDWFFTVARVISKRLHVEEVKWSQGSGK